jgi:RHS repeat-associated protein
LALVGHREWHLEADPPPPLLLLGDRSVVAVDPVSLESRPVRGERPSDPSDERQLGTVGLHGSNWTGRGKGLLLVNEVGHELTRVAAAGEVLAISADPVEAVLWSVEGRTLVTRDLVSGALLRSRALPELAAPIQLAAASRSGLVWLATGDSVLVAAPDGGSRQLDLPSPVDAIRVDGRSAAWALAGGELYHLSEDAVLEVPLPSALAQRDWIDLEARSGVVWLTDGGVLARLEPHSGKSTLREIPAGVRRLRLASADRSPPEISWDIEVDDSSETGFAKRRPSRGTTLEIRLSVDEVGSGVAAAGVRLVRNGGALTDTCRAGVGNTFLCRAVALYEGGRLVLEARVEDRAGNRSNRLRASWRDPRAASQRAATVEVALPPVTDTYLGASKANKTYGSKRWMRLRRGGFDRPALRFDLAATAAEIETLQAAYLELTITDNRDDWGSGRLVDVYRATSPWTESGATWNCADDANPGNPVPDCVPEWWGGDHAVEPTDSVLHTNGMSGRVAFDVTADVEGFLGGLPHHGWLLMHESDGSGSVRYASREHQAALAPRLRLVFEPLTPDQTPPVVAFVWPTDGAHLEDARPIIELAVADDDSGVDTDTLALQVDGVEIGSTCLRALGLFCSLDEPLPAGVVTITATVEDLAGNVSSPAHVTLTVGPQGPSPVNALLTSASAPADGVTTVTGLPEAAPGLTVLTATNLASGAEESSPVGADGSFELSLAAGPGDVLELVVTDGEGLESPPVSVLVPVPGACHAPPDPSLIVDPSPVLNYDLYEHSRFLWESEPAVQVGVVAGALTADNLALVRGRVLDRAGDVLPGVSVSVLDGSEYGCTASRVDGAYELAFGGGTVVLEFARQGYFAVQRRVTLPFGRQRTLADVVLTAWPDTVTTVDSGQQQVQVARGAVETDANGARQATLLVPEGVTATLELPDGSSQPAPPLTVRIREFTVGEDGPEAMPGVLPPASAYTYAFEATADEAEALGAEIVFSQPVYKYLENYLGFPVGYAMPVGYYDKRAGVWVPSANGLVLAILSIDGSGRAEVDVDGSGQPADAAALTALGFTDAERVELANLYAIGQELWRTPIPHLTPYDCNAPWIFSPSDSVQPDPDVTAGGGEVCSDQQGGSILECQSQVFRDAIPIAGTPFALHYSSERVPGREFGRSVEIVLTPEEVPESLAGVILIVEVVGRKFRFTYPPVPNQTTTFVWDGLDVHGRPVIGQVLLEGRVGFVYPLDYGSASGDPGFGLPPNSSVSVRTALQQIVSWAEFSVVLESLNFGQTGGQLGIGMSGWSLTPQHVHTVQARRSGELHRGDGSRYPSKQPAAEDVALLSGSQVPTYIWQGDAWTLQNVSFSDVAGLAVDAEGNVYFSTSSAYAIYQLRPDGAVYRMAGGGSATTWDDGVPAVTALLDRPRRLTVGPDGTLYVAEVGGDRIRRILPGEPLESRLIETVAQLDAPMDVSIGPDGGLYTAIYVPGSAHRVLRVDLESGQIATYAGGNGAACSLPDRGDNGPGLQACLILASSSILRMAWMADGSLLIPEGGGSVHASRIRRLWPDGTITTFMGDDTQGDPAYGQHYLNSNLHNPVFVAVDPVTGHIAIVDRSIVLGDGRLSLIVEGDIIVLGAWPAASHIEWGLDGNLYWARDPLGGQGTSIRQRRQSDLEEADGAFRVPTPDGSEIYLFSAEGRHLETIDAYTGELVYGFHYNAAGQLYEIEDRYAEKVTIERDGSGHPSSITAPSGQVTHLTVDGAGDLTSVTNPEGETWRLVYGDGGLLETVTSPRLYSKALTYDSLGRLLTHTDARLATKTLTRSTGTSEYDVTFTTAEGRSTVYEVTRNPDGSQNRTRTEVGGVVTTTLLREDLSRTETLPDGTSIDLQFTGDPRFGARAPMPDLSVSTPLGNLTRTTTVARDFTLVDPEGSPGDPANLATFTEEVSVNGKVYTSNFDAESRTWLLTSPEGRTVTTVLNAEGEVESIQRPSVEPVTFIYDDQGRLEESRTGTGALERITTFVYDPIEGWLDTVTDAETRTLGWQRDLVGRPEVTEYPDSRTLATAFDDNGNLESLTPPSRPAHGFTYDEVDLPETYQAPGNPVESYAFNLDRQPETLTLPSGQTMSWLYDPVTRRLEQVDTAADDHRFAYVPNTNQIQSIEHWPEGYQTGAPQTTAYTYDGFLPLGTAWSGPISGSVTQSYDHDFRIWDQFVNNQWQVTYGYDLDSLVTSVATLTDSLSIVRDPATGWIDHTTLGSVTTSQGYNEFGELDSFAANAGASPLYSASYVRDHLGRIEQKTETVNGTTSIYDYDYDPAGRLDTVYKDTILVEDYGYDDNDNRTSYDGTFGPATGSYDDQDRLESYGGVDYDFDADGYLTSKSAGGSTTTYDYDLMGSLRKVVLDTGITIEYLIDGQNRRVGKMVDGTLTKGFLYQDQLNPVAELDGAGNVVARFVYGTKAHVPDYMVTAGKTYRLITDHLGSVRLVVDTATGAVAQRLDYDSFGRITYDTNPTFQPFAYAGGLYDPQTGLTRFGARDYDAQTGRWTAKDPLEFGGGDTNLYGYALQNPVNIIDPSGASAIDAIQIALDAVGLVPGFGEVADGINGVIYLLMGDCVNAAFSFAAMVPGLGVSATLAKHSRRAKTVIGKLKDLEKLGPGEHSLLRHLSPNLGSPRANWARNSSVLRQEMRKGIPIRDATVRSNGQLIDSTGFLGAERNLLASQGWTYNPSSTLWSPPR